MILLLSPTFEAQNEAIREHIGHVAHLVDIGAGIRERFAESNTPTCDKRTTVDVWAPYAPDVVADACALPFADREFDAALLHDVIEHLTKVDGWRAIREAQRVSKRGVLIRTPLGFVENPQPEGGAWGKGVNPHQAHLSGWRPEDLASVAEVAWVITGHGEVGDWRCGKPPGEGWWSCWVPSEVGK